MFVHDREKDQEKGSRKGRLSVFMHVTMKRNEVLLIWSTVGENWTCVMEHCDLERRKPHPHFPADSPGAASRYDDNWRREEIHRGCLVGRTGPADVYGTWWLMGRLASQG